MQMVVTKDYIGDVICRFDNGERFVINHISDNLLFYQSESGARGCMAAHSVDGGVERDPERIESFRKNVAFANVLEAAENAARRRFAPGQGDALDLMESDRVLDVTKEQRSTYLARLQEERQTVRPGAELAGQFLDSLHVERPGCSATFFGVTVLHQNEAEPSFCINGGVYSREDAAAYLSDVTLNREERATSFSDLISSAQHRAAQQAQGANKARDFSRDEI